VKSDIIHFQLNYKFYVWNRLHEFYLNDAIQLVDPTETDRIALENDIFRTKPIRSSQYVVGFLATESRRKISDRFLSNPIISETTQPNAFKIDLSDYVRCTRYGSITILLSNYSNLSVKVAKKEGRKENIFLFYF